MSRRTGTFVLLAALCLTASVRAHHNFMTRNWEIMAVEVTTTPTFQAGPPRLLFKVPGPLPGPPGSYIARDGQRFVLPMPSSAVR